jgi:hypothetical protein
MGDKLFPHPLLNYHYSSDQMNIKYISDGRKRPELAEDYTKFEL